MRSGISFAAVDALEPDVPLPAQPAVMTATDVRTAANTARWVALAMHMLFSIGRWPTPFSERPAAWGFGNCGQLAAER